MSVPCGLPSGAELAAWMRALPFISHIDFESLPGGQQDNPLWVAQHIVDQDSRLRNDLLREVSVHLARLEFAATPSPALLSLAQTPNRPALIITLNYDRLVEAAAAKVGRKAETLGIDDIPGLLANGLAEPDGTLRVLHLHGSLGDSSDALVLDASSYAARASDHRVSELFGAVLPYFNLCILGTSFEEQYLATALLARRPDKPRHVIVCDAALADRIEQGTAQLTSKIHNIVICDYPAGEHDVLDPFCDRLTQCAPHEESGQPVTAESERDADPFYEPRRFIDSRDRARSDIDDIETALYLKRYEVLDESDLRAERRAIVVGVPGGGKSSLLMHLAVDPSAGERAVFVRLRDVREFMGEDMNLLQVWMRAGLVLDGGGTIAETALADGSVRIHLLLDGLDELPRVDRLQAAAAIDRIGQAFPDQRITVSSRPTSALEGFDEQWRQLELLCDSQWRSRLLARMGSNEGELVKQLGPLYRVVEPLLRVPFFLRGMHELLEAGETPQDGLDLSLSLLRRLLSTDPQLQAFAATLDRWLLRVALTMSLAGSATVSVDGLRVLAGDLDIGDPDLLAELLASRSLLLEKGDQYAFQHRVFGEALVADHLIGEDPCDWIDVLAPRVEGGHALLREDWAGVADFLLPRSAEWRASIAERDPRAAARATPVDAPKEEREKAATYLWDRAQKLDVWIDRMGASSVRSDGDVVSALIAAGGLDELNAAVRKAVVAGTRFQRGNAVDVVAGARFIDAERLLRRVLVDDEDSVVRRIAAGSARRLQLVALLGPLERRASEPADETEAAGMASAVLSLTPKAERIDVAIRLVYARNTEVHDWNVVDDLPVGAQLRWFTFRALTGGGDKWWMREHLDELLGQLGRLTRRQQGQVGMVLARAETRSPEAVDYLRKHPSASVGLIDVLERGPQRPYEISGLLLAAGSKNLARHGASRAVLDYVESWEYARANPAPPFQEESAETEPTAPPTLGQVLAIDDPDKRFQELLAGLELWARQIGEASSTVQSALADELDGLWAVQDLRSGVATRTSGATIKAWAQLILTLGPQLRWRLTDDRWIQVATCGWLWQPQKEWLRDQATPNLVARALLTDPSARALADLSAFVDDSNLEDLVATIVRQPPGLLDEWSGQVVVARLADGRRSDLLHRLADHDAGVGMLVESKLAASGDVEAQEAALRGLIAQLSDGQRPDRSELAWLEAAEDPSLFRLVAMAMPLAATLRRDDEPPSESVLAPLQVAAERIDLKAAIMLYEGFIAAPPWFGAQFLVERRDDLVQQLVMTEGQRAAIRVANRLGLPLTQVEDRGD